MSLTDLPDTPPVLARLYPEMPIVRRVLRLGTWVMLAVITQFFVNAADSYMVGRLEPEIATPSQAALGLGMPLFWAVGGFFSAVSFGTQAMTARRYAEGAYRQAGKVLFNSLLVGVAAGLLGSLLGLWLTAPVLDFVAAASREQRDLAVAYTSMRMFGVLGMVVTFSYKAFFDGIGRTYVHLWAALAMNLANIGLNYLFIYGSPSLSIPRMELEGAGLASVLSTYMGLALMVAVSLSPKIAKVYRVYRRTHLDTAIMGRIIQLLLPSGSATVILMAGFLLFMRFIGLIDAAKGGNTYSAATKAIMDTAAICFMPLIALGTATATAVSQSLGARKPNLAARYGWESVRLGVVAMLVVGSIFAAFPHEIISMWSPNDPAVAKAGASSLRLMVTAFPLMVVGLVLSQALYGAGANLYVMSVELALHLGFLVPVSWLLGPVLGYGMEGVWFTAAMYVNLLGVAMGTKFLGQGWRTIRL